MYLSIALVSGHRRLTFLRLATATALLIPLAGHAAELSDDVRALGKERRDEVIAQAKQQVVDLEKQRADAAKGRNMARVSVLLGQIKQAKLELSRVTKKTVDDYANELVKADGNNDRGAARPPLPPDHGGVGAGQAMPAQSPERDPAAEQAAEVDEAERQKVSGGCPLKIIKANFYHADVDSIRRGARLGGQTSDIPADLFGECTFVLCTIDNCLDEPVEAYELLVQFIDGFDEVIKEQTLQGTLLASHEERLTKNGWRKIDTAVQVRVFLQRTKLPNGQIWRREPHHERISVLVKKPEGAELGR